MISILIQLLQEIITKGRWTQFYAAVCCLSAFWMLFRLWQKKEKILSAKKYFALFLWFFGFLWWFFNFLGLCVLSFSFYTGLFLIQVASVFLTFHLYCFLPLLFLYFTSNKKSNIIFGLIVAIGWFSFMFYYLITSAPIRRAPESIYLVSPKFGFTPGFFMGFLAIFFTLVAWLAIFLNFKRGVFSLYDLSSLYFYFSIIIYASTSILNVFFIPTHHLTYFIFTLVPVLTYFGIKKELYSKPIS